MTGKITGARLRGALTSLGYAGSEGLFNGHQPNPTHLGRSVTWREIERRVGDLPTYFRGSTPLVTFAAGSRDVLKDVHRRLWNFGRVRLLIGTDSDSVVVLDCFAAPSQSGDIDEVTLATASLSTVSTSLAAFSRGSVDDGSLDLGDVPNRNSSRVDYQLLKNLRFVREALSAHTPLEYVDSLILRSIFARYLEARGMNGGDGGDGGDGPSFLSCLRSHPDSAYQVFERLHRRFNGDLFLPTPDERSVVDRYHLSLLADFLSGTDMESGQAALWPYDFGIIPADLISSIYEALLDDPETTGAYYTPRSVVQLVLDQVFDDLGTDAPTVLDPACGSGVFLAESLRRLVQLDRLKTPGPASVERITALLTKNIFGVDSSPAALLVAAFSLYLTFLDEIDDLSELASVRLPRLRDMNLIEADTFAAPAPVERSFDVVVGNPPWRSKLSPAAKRFVHEHQLPVADKQIATAFLWRAFQSVSPEGRFALVMPAKALLHNRSGPAKKSREAVFSRLPVESIFDLSPLRHGLFATASAPAAVVVGRATDSNSDSAADAITFVAIHRSSLSQATDALAVSPDHIHLVPRALARRSDDVWKTLLWGTELDLDFLQGLRLRHSSLGDLVKKRGWICSRGFQVKGGDSNPSDALVGLPIVPAQAIACLRLDSEPIQLVETRVMHRPREPALYRGPHILIRRGLVDNGRIAASFLNDDAAFNDSVVGIAGSPRDKNLLRAVTAYVSSSMGRYFHFCTSSSWGVERDYVDRSEHLEMPIPEPGPAAFSRVLDTLLAAERSRGAESAMDALDEAVFDAYGLTNTERQLVLDTVNFAIPAFYSGAQESPPPLVVDLQLQEYAESFVSMLSSVAGLPAEFTGATRQGTNAIVTIELGAKHAPADQRVQGMQAVFRESLDRHSDDATTSLLVQPSFVWLSDDTIHVLKPNEARYWTKSNARLDATDVIGRVSQMRRNREPSQR